MEINNEEITKALNEFEALQKKEEKQEQEAENLKASSTEIPKLVRGVMKVSGGLIKEQKQAEYFLLGLVVVLMVASLFLFFSGNFIGFSSKQTTTNTETFSKQLPGIPMPTPHLRTND